MNDAFRIGFEWLDRETGDAVDRATFAQIEITANGRQATRLEDLSARTVRSHVRASAHALAVWLAANWWRLRWEPWAASASLEWRLSHNLASAGEGYVWPRLFLSSDGESVRVDNDPTQGEPEGSVRYLDRFQTRVPVDVFVLEVEQFIEAVLERVASVVDEPTPLHVLWNDVRQERADPAMAAWRRLEAKLGFDPGEAPEALVETLIEMSAATGQNASEEVAVAVGANAPRVLQELLASRSDAGRMTVPDAEAIGRRSRAHDSAFAFPWQRAVAMAHDARDAWGLPPGPLHTAALADLFSVSADLILDPDLSTRVPMPAAFREPDSDGRLGVVLTSNYVTGRRFALARLVGDHLSNSGDRLLPATSARTARQKLQRAFAQEFLCPVRDLVEFLDRDALELSEEDVEAAAHHFDVSPLLIESTLRNNGYPRLSR